MLPMEEFGSCGMRKHTMCKKLRMMLNSYAAMSQIQKSTFACYMTVVYGYNAMEQRKDMWKKLQNLAPGKQPWLISGDFNAMLTPQDRISKVPMTLADIHDFAKWYHNLYLTEIPWRGEYFTWTNKQQGDDRVRSRLDIIFGNDCWMMQHGHLTVNFEDPFISDHASMLILITQPTTNIKVPFRYFNVWADHSEFPHIVATGWNQNHVRGRMKSIWYKLKELKLRFKQLNKEEYKGVKRELIKQGIS
ncbi:PREDICTED: uncharacterized protein LOC109209465 [Nicotiana attenuata]|uniref:uncharacterized protein LOC109209465 n=1 Tax=Nicotiana attenuata TaxID=49451 RepID=UPI000905651B|nr:PREDICTED: uncharacterized protein LOC109209465 [Nicotiana attenuata]